MGRLQLLIGSAFGDKMSAEGNLEVEDQDNELSTDTNRDTLDGVSADMEALANKAVTQE